MPLLSDDYRIEQAELLANPTVQLLTSPIIGDIAIGKLDRASLDSYEFMVAARKRFEYLGIPFRTIGAPAEAIRTIVDKHFAEIKTQES